MKKIVKKNFLFIKILFCNIIFNSFFLAYIGQRFNTDSYAVIEPMNHIHEHISALRFFGAGVYKIYTYFGHSPMIDGTLDVILYIFIVSFSCALLACAMIKILNRSDVVSVIIVDMAVLLSVDNVWFANLVTFPECIFITAIGVLCCFSSVTLFIYRKKSKKNWILSGLLLVLAAGVYQQFIILFTVFVLAVFVIELNEETVEKKSAILFRYLSLFAFIIVCAAVYFAVAKLTIAITNNYQNQRIGISFSSIIGNIKYFVSNQHSFLKGRGFFNTEIMSILFVVLSAFLFVLTLLNAKRKQCLFKGIVFCISYVAAYMSSYFLGAISDARAARVYVGIFTYLAICAILIVYFTDKKVVRYLLLTSLVLFICVNAVKIVRVAQNQNEQNIYDKIYANQIIDCIKEYESTHQKITTLAFCEDEHSKVIQDSVQDSAFSFSHSTKGIMNFYSGREFQYIDNTSEVKDKYFKGKDWNWFDSDEQIVFDGDVAYICIY